MTLKGQEKVQGQLKGTEEAAKKLAGRLKMAGAALTAVGAAGLVLVAKAKKLNAQLSVTAINLGATTKEMRDLTLATANVTFPIDEVIKSFDLLARAGVTNQRVLADTATAFDTLGDAVGIPASQVTSYMVPAMKTFNLTAEEMAGKTDSLTYMTRNTTLSLADFNTMVGYTTPELVEQGLTIDDLTVALIHMEKQGYAPGRVMTREFMKATTLAAKEQIPLTEALGMTTEEVIAYKVELEKATGITQEYADAANAQYGIMDKLKFMWSKLTFQIGSALVPFEAVFAAMAALGPVLLIFSTVVLPRFTFSTVRATIAQWGLNRAMLANPIIAIIAGITALVIALIYLWRNWESVSLKMEGAWLSFKNLVGMGVDTTQVRLDALEIERAWMELVKKVKEGLDTMLYEVESYVSQAILAFEEEARVAITSAETWAREEKAILQSRADFFRDKHYERLELINEEMLAEIKAFDPVLAREIEAAQERIKILDEHAEEREAAARKRRIEDLEEQLEADDLTKHEEERLEHELQAVKEAGEKERILEDTAQLISEAHLEDHYDNQMALVDEHLARQVSYWEDTWLPAQKEVYQEDLKNFKEYHKDAENLTAEHVEKLLEIYQRVVPEEERMEFILPGGPPPPKRWKPELWELLTLGLAGAAIKEMMGYEHGGAIPEPTLLYGLRSKRAYAVAGEAGVEYVSRERGAGAGATTINNYFQGPWFVREEADIHRIAMELKTLQDRTERRAGLRGG